jgi:hypothetical protein
MTRAEFRAALLALDLTLSEFAALTGYTAAQVYTWGNAHHGRVQRVPKWVPLLLAAWRGQKPPSLENS